MTGYNTAFVLCGVFVCVAATLLAATLIWLLVTRTSLLLELPLRHSVPRVTCNKKTTSADSIAAKVLQPSAFKLQPLSSGVDESKFEAATGTAELLERACYDIIA